MASSACFLSLLATRCQIIRERFICHACQTLTEMKVTAELTHLTGLIICEVSDSNFIERHFIWLNRNFKKFDTFMLYFICALWCVVIVCHMETAISFFHS
jgi:hypothetical protein